MKKPLTFICRQKIKLILHIFLEILQRYCKLAVLGTLGVPGYVNPKWYYQLKENFRVYCRQNIKFTPPPFLEILQRYTNFLFWVPWACLVAHTQNESINLQKTSMLICMPKINFINHFFLEILHFKESFNLIGWHHFGS